MCSFVWYLMIHSPISRRSRSCERTVSVVGSVVGFTVFVFNKIYWLVYLWSLCVDQLQYWKTSDVLADESMRERRIIYTEPSSCWRYSMHRASRDPRSPSSTSGSIVDADQVRSTRNVNRYRYPKHVDSGNRMRFKSNSPIDRLHQVRLHQQQSSHGPDDSDSVTKAVRGRLDDLWPFTNISIRVSVVNTKYQGPPTDVITIMTAESGKPTLRLQCSGEAWVLSFWLGICQHWGVRDRQGSADP